MTAEAGKGGKRGFPYDDARQQKPTCCFSQGDGTARVGQHGKYRPRQEIFPNDMQPNRGQRDVVD
jgi:hypothetical protein